MGMVWRTMRPGPVTTVWNTPSPPKIMFLTPFTAWMSREQVASIMARLPVSTIICWPGPRSYSTASPSISRKAVPRPDSFCMMKPSPPKKPAPSFFWKKTDRSTSRWAARKAVFCTTMGRSGVISTARMLPGKLEAKAIMPEPSRAV